MKKISDKKPTLGVIAVAKKNHQKDEVYEFLKYLEETYAKSDTLSLMLKETILLDESETVLQAKKMEQEGVDAILFIVGTWIYSSVLVSAVNDIHVPFIIYGLSDHAVNGNLGASLQVRYVLQEIGKRFLYLSGPIRDDDNHQKIVQFTKAAWVKRYLRNRTIATIGGKCMMMYQTQVNEYSWKRVFGVDFPQFDAVQVFKEMENVDENEVKKVEAEFLEKIDEIHWQAGSDTIEKDAVFSQAKMFLAFKRLKNMHKIDIFANKCMPEMMSIPFGYGYAACLATCMLNEEGIITACEADVPAALSMYILSLLSGSPSFFADIAKLNKDENKLSFFNCGTAPLSLADTQKGVHIWPMPGNIADDAAPEKYYVGKMKGGTVRFDLENDREVTILRVGGNDKTLRFHVAKATTVAREIEPDDVIGQRWPGFGLIFKEDLHRFFENTTGHHYSLVYGNYVEELRYLAEIYEIGFFYNE